MAAVINEVKGNSVYDYLLNSIRTGVITSGQTLTERGLAEKLGVSRTPIREAFRKLAELGLVKYEPHKGVKVITLSLDRVGHLYDVRELLEGLAVRTLTKLNDSEALAELKGFIDQAEKEVAVNNINELSVINAEFHKALARYSKNTYLEDIMNILQTHISLMMSTSLSNTGRPLENIEEHKMIIHAIKSGDADFAENIAKYHVRQARAHAIKMLEKGGME
jgi:DNA-binding GntR family transcriptional regulator